MCDSDVSDEKVSVEFVEDVGIFKQQKTRFGD